MPIETAWINGGDFTGFLARPAGTLPPLPSVLVVQEIFGVEAHIEDVAKRLAAAGYAALAPDLFAGGGTRPDALGRERIAEVQACMDRLPPGTWGDPAARAAALAQLPGSERARIEETGAAILPNPGKLQDYVRILRSAARHLRQERTETRGEAVACVGFCMGGGLSALLACEDPELAGAAVFYGSAPPLEKVPQIRCPVVGFYGALDARINAGLPAFTEAMARAGKRFDPHVYEGAAHGFFNDTRPVYDVCAARDAFARLLAFLRSAASP